MIKISTILILQLSVILFEIQAQPSIISAKASIIKQQEFGREQIKKKLNSKIKNKQPLFVHVFVPLCDNENQGIVKVGGKLGEGRNLKTNLYWGAGYGLKTFFLSAQKLDKVKRFRFHKRSCSGKACFFEEISGQNGSFPGY